MLFVLLTRAIMEVWLEQRARERTKNYKGKNHQRQQGGEEKKTPRKDANGKLHQNKYQDKRWKHQATLKLVWLQPKMTIVVTPEMERKSIFCSFWRNDKQRSSQSHAERQYKTLIKSDSDSHVNWRTIQYKIGPNWEIKHGRSKWCAATTRARRKCFQAVSGFLPTYWERGPERHSCTVAARVWRHLARSGRELVSLWGLERVWSLGGEWVEIQGITQGGVQTTEQQSAKRPFHWNGNFYCWEAAAPCDEVPFSLLPFRATRAFMKHLLLFSCTSD